MAGTSRTKWWRNKPIYDSPMTEEAWDRVDRASDLVRGGWVLALFGGIVWALRMLFSRRSR